MSTATMAPKTKSDRKTLARNRRWLAMAETLGWSPAEIAEAVGTPPGVVARGLAAARPFGPLPQVPMAPVLEVSAPEPEPAPELPPPPPEPERVPVAVDLVAEALGCAVDDLASGLKVAWLSGRLELAMLGGEPHVLVTPGLARRLGLGRGPDGRWAPVDEGALGGRRRRRSVDSDAWFDNGWALSALADPRQLEPWELAAAAEEAA